MIEFRQIQPRSHQKVAYAEVNYKTKQDLFDFLQKHKVDLKEIKYSKNERRQIEWMTIRGMLIELLPEFCDIYYDEHRKPHLKDCPQYLSISHSHHKVAVSIDEKNITGVDLQHITDKVINIREKFLNEIEQKRKNTQTAEELTLYWSVKEALFKIYGKKDIFLKDNIQVNELHFNGSEGTAIGSIKAYNYFSEHFLELKLIDGYVLAYVVN